MLNQKGSSLIVGLLLGLLIAGALFGGYYYFSPKNSRPSGEATPTPVKVNFPAPSTMPTPSAIVSSDINGFPIYPNAQFIEIRDIPPCTEGEYSGFSTCNATTYTWRVQANYDQLTTFFKEDKSGAGWKCSGGAGAYTDSNNATGKTGCEKGDLKYDLAIDTKNGSSEYILIIPKGPPTGDSK